MPFYIMYFNPRDGVSEWELGKKSKELYDHRRGKVDGLGSWKLYRHYQVGANPRTYQMRIEFKEFSTWDGFVALNEKDTKA